MTTLIRNIIPFCGTNAWHLWTTSTVQQTIGIRPNTIQNYVGALFFNPPGPKLSGLNITFRIYPNHSAIRFQPPFAAPSGIFVHGANNGLAAQKYIVRVHSCVALPQLDRLGGAHQDVSPAHDEITAVHIV